MSPRVDMATVLPRKRRHYPNPRDRMVAEALDHQLYGYALSQARFSIPEVRDVLLQLPELEGIDDHLLRYRIRDRLKTLQNHELVDEVGVAGRRPKWFRMRPEVAGCEASAEPSTTPPSDESSESPSTDRAVLMAHLEQERRRLQAAMQVAMGEAEHYKRLITQFPDDRAAIAPLLEAAIDKNGTLQGQWEANLKLRRALSGDSASQEASGDQGGRA
ncbi:hypothetical protein [Halomonas piscis]|uniref:hypothetical protein n=1 Tax=Halomonas piscis TaxID=3031727 RepID=UPI00289AABCB|nr:hypothetical protein [Halomonas piscis]